MDKARDIDRYHGHKFWTLPKVLREATYRSAERAFLCDWSEISLERRIVLMRVAVEIHETRKDDNGEPNGEPQEVQGDVLEA